MHLHIDTFLADNNSTELVVVHAAMPPLITCSSSVVVAQVEKEDYNSRMVNCENAEDLLELCTFAKNDDLVSVDGGYCAV